MKHTVGVIDLPETNVISTVGVQVACIGIATRLVRSNATVSKSTQSRVSRRYSYRHDEEIAKRKLSGMQGTYEQQSMDQPSNWEHQLEMST
jgi:hypothetical protein